MSTLIIQMPRKWQKEGKVRGIALSRERFQFIFNSEHDLLDVLEKGVQTHNEWVIVLERWTENPPDDYLQFIPLWIRISNIPVNFYTVEALSKLGDVIGKVELVAFDPSKPITQDFIRVRVKFNVTNSLRMSKAFTHKGKSFIIHYDYENIQKRCFTCFRLNHEKDHCPITIRQRQEEAMKRRSSLAIPQAAAKSILKEDDPLKGVLSDHQVGINPLNGRPKIAKDVLEEMRRYLVADTGEDRDLKVFKIKQSVSLAESDPTAQKLVLQLEAPPQVTKDVNKGKGLVFDYSRKSESDSDLRGRMQGGKLMASALDAHKIHSARSDSESLPLREFEVTDGCLPASLSDGPTGFSSGFYESGAAGTVKKRQYQRRRPPKAKRTQRKLDEEERKMVLEGSRREGKEEMGSKKRKCSTGEEECRSNSKAPCLKVIPNEGLPNPQ